MGIEVGANVNPGLDSGYGLGIGRGFILGAGNGTWSGELLLGQSFSSEHELGALRAANNPGETKLSAVVGRYTMLQRGTMWSVMAGIARVTVPYLTADGDSANVAGLGLVLGGGAAVRLVGPVSLAVELRAVLPRYEIPGEVQLVNPVEQADGTVMGNMTTDDLSAIPVFATVGVRLWF